ncbi:AMP-binding protein [Propioniciclava sinopodophylli]|uniref:AMP-binding protein n=1 Tax=Propioniciclava sinopodophylli TaxID=1837344 RepID=UPI002490D75D|nr:AMP-binding protein [Propioniciclava sinopodophylli]
MTHLAWGGGGTSAEAVHTLYDRLLAPGPVLVMAPTRAAFEASVARITQPLDGVDVVIQTSGSTDGTGRLVGLSRAALAASAHATHARLGGPGQWLTSLPVHSVAGFQVVRRSALAGHRPVVYAPAGGFDVDLFAAGIAKLTPGVPHYLSMVPTQLYGVVAEAPQLLAGFAAILVGGAALAPDLAARASAAGARIVRTYGSTETSGGCVYDGVPLDGVGVRVVEGRVHLGGPTLLTRYLESADQPFAADGWLVTNDVGTWDGARLSVLGRADDVLISGGVNVHPAPVEAALSALGGQWVVVGVPDERWGQRVVAVTDGVLPDMDAVRAATADLAPAERPKDVLGLAPLPLRPTGKVDRRAVAEYAARRFVRGTNQ